MKRGKLLVRAIEINARVILAGDAVPNDFSRVLVDWGHK